MKVEVSNGELIDKLTILEIKLKKIPDKEKLKNVRKEYEILKKASGNILGSIETLYRDLLKINEELWEIEDRVRELEKNKNFGENFIETARSVYIKNDKRARIKQEINKRTNSELSEEKSYEDY